MKSRPENAAQRAGARTFLLSLTVAGALVLGHSIYVSWQQFDARWLYLLALTVFAACFPVTLPVLRRRGQSMTVTMGDVFVFGGLLIFGPAVGVVLAAAEGASSSFRVRIGSLNKISFNTAQMALAAFLSGHFLMFLRAQAPPSTAMSSLLGFGPILLLVAVGAACYFLLNTMMVATALHLATGRPLVGLWKRNFMCVMPAYFINASAAALIFLLTPQIDVYLSSVVASMIVIAYFGFALWFKQRTESLRPS